MHAWTATVEWKSIRNGETLAQVSASHTAARADLSAAARRTRAVLTSFTTFII